MNENLAPQKSSIHQRVQLLLIPVLAAFLFTAVAQAQISPPAFSKEFLPSSIGPGSTSMLRFVIANPNELDPIGNIAFTDVLPAGVVIASPANASTDCTSASLSAADGGTTISLTNAELGADSECSVTVLVTSSILATHTNVSGTLTSDAGATAGATADLNVVATLPGFSKSFSPSSISVGGISTLTLLFDNSTAGAVDQFELIVADVLPTGMVVATPSNASTDCSSALQPAILTAFSGSGLVSLASYGFAPGFPVLSAGSTCSVTVDVTTETAGSFGNVSGALEINDAWIGYATAKLEVALSYLNKVFTDDPVPPGATVNLELTVTNLNRSSTADNITFTDDLDATLSGLVATGLPLADPCGAGSTLSGTSLLTLTGGTLGAEQSCTFSVTLQVPAGATPGAYANTTGTVTSDLWTGNSATDTLVVASIPDFTKSFLVDPVATGGTTTLEFTITNTSPTSVATDIEFFDSLVTFLPFPVSATLPAPDFCGSGSTMSLAIRPGTADEQGLEMTGGSLQPAGTAGDSCTFTVDIDIPSSLAGGIHTNTTDPIVATVDGETVTGKTATDTLTVVAAPQLSKAFSDDPVAPGGTVTLDFTLIHDEFAAADATGITFTDDLVAVLSGLVATGLPMTDLCGSGNGTLTGSAGDTLLTFSGATLTPGQVCTFQATLQVPGGAAAGTYTNTTSSVTATVNGIATTGGPAQDNLTVTGFLVSKELIDDPVLPGGTVTLRFTLDNTSGTTDANNVSFTDTFDDGLVALPPLPVSPCGGTLSGTTSLSFSGGSVTAGLTCSFDVTLQVPTDAVSGTYLNTTSVVSAELPSSPAVSLPAASASWTVDSNPLLLAKSFLDDPAIPGGTVTLELSLTNTFSQPASAIGFTDDLDAVLSGLVAIGLPASVCGGTVDGTSVLSLSGASIGAGEPCAFNVTLMVPAATPAGIYSNTTSQVTGTIDSLAVTGTAASDDLHIQALAFSKEFDGPTLAGGRPVLTFTIENLDASAGVSGMVFGDNLEAALTGLVATGLPVNDVCGTGSQLAGTSFLTLNGANLGPSGSCVLPVTLQVPGDAAAGTYINTTTGLFLIGLAATVPATAELVIEPPPAFSKSFSPDHVGVGEPSRLTFIIDNTASVFAALDLDFTDNLPAGLQVATLPNATTTCTGGTITAVAGTSVLSYSGGTVAAGSSCEVEVDIVATVDGAFVNTTGDLTSSNGTSGEAVARLTVGHIFADDFESGNTSAWTSTVY
jgi:uncharacterized repeat protein (TIGR01451 family)